jgi:DNA-binding CsgD family transcriptional regulator/tetratricopeptide (TPR) repeat protein
MGHGESEQREHDELERGRESYARRAWLHSYAELSVADQAVPLGAEDIERLATSAYMLGRDDEHLGGLERAHQVYLDAGETLRAARCAFWVGMHLSVAGEMGRATGWLGRAQRLVEREGRECVEQGYLLLPLMFQHEAGGDFEAGAAIAADAAATSERFGDADLFGLAVHMQGHLLIKQGRVVNGLALLDEAMVAVTAGEMSPIVSGLVYCGVILGCQDAYEVGRAREWTAALTKWCEQQPDMVSFTGRCLVHRAQILLLGGAWPDALEEARRAGQRCGEGNNQLAVGEAAYLQGDVHRLEGEFAAAEEAYRDASRCGWEPQPGLALLRLAQGNGDAAAAAIRRVAGETTEASKRAGLLPAYVEIMLAVGDIQEARRACRELEEISEDHASDMLGAMVVHARGAVDLAEGDTRAALVALRRAAQLWQELEAPYEAARSRWLVGLACRALGDDDAATLELDAARVAFTELGAAPDLARIDSLAQHVASGDAHGLSPRELEVLRLVAAGGTNKAIAAELVLSERTVDRHVSNIFTKLRVSSRAAATAYAYEHELV